jgi:ketosteroid isomerase-like protein
MINRAFIDNFATEWIDAWIRHDLDQILSHYTNDFEMSSPAIVRLVDEPTGVLKGKEAVGAYWAKALQLKTQSSC